MLLPLEYLAECGNIGVHFIVSLHGRFARTLSRRKPTFAGSKQKHILSITIFIFLGTKQEAQRFLYLTVAGFS